MKAGVLLPEQVCGRARSLWGVEMIRKTVRDKTYNLGTYLKSVSDGDICENADVQRLAGSFDKREINEMVYTVLTSDHIPELILAECSEDDRIYIADGLQRTTMLKLFRFGNYKISSAIDNPLVRYMRKMRDDSGRVIKNERDQALFEEAELDIRNKTYDSLPEELKKEFDEFQLRVVIHEDCTMKRISELIKRYNNQRPMTAAQRAFTYMDNFAVRVRAISNRKLFVECGGYTEREKSNGAIERIVAESVMCTFHPDHWKKSAKDVCIYLNQNADESEFQAFEELADRLGRIYTPDFNRAFTGKNSFIWFRIFYIFTGLGLEDRRFADFVGAFHRSLRDRAVEGVSYRGAEGVTYAMLDREQGTKDRSLVLAKLGILEALMKEYFQAPSPEECRLPDAEAFLSENLQIDRAVLREDMELYNDTLDCLTDNAVRVGSRLLERQNRLSLLAMVAYSYQEDADLDRWLGEYAEKNPVYYADQRKNFIHMRNDFNAYRKRAESA